MRRAFGLWALGMWACAGEPFGASPTTASLEAGSGVADTFTISAPEAGMTSMWLGRATSDAADASNVDSSTDSASERPSADPSDGGFLDGTNNETADSAWDALFPPTLDASADEAVESAPSGPACDPAYGDASPGGACCERATSGVGVVCTDGGVWCLQSGVTCAPAGEKCVTWYANVYCAP